MERSAEHISHVIIDIDNMKSLQSIPKNQATDNPILQVYIKLISVGSRIICRYLYQQLPQVPILIMRDHIFFLAQNYPGLIIREMENIQGIIIIAGLYLR